ncbi:MAG: hypothetical protein GY780_12725 [bacterium]|nr:hypothetical protein [bacterium]
MILLPVSAFAGVPEELQPESGLVNFNCLSFLYEVTFMSIDVAVVEVCYEDSTAGLITSVVQNNDPDQTSLKNIEKILNETEKLVFSMTFQRDAGIDRLAKGSIKNLKRGMQNNLITENECQLLCQRFEELFSPFQERGGIEGDRLFYLVGANQVQLVFLGFDEEVLFDSLEEGEVWGRGVKSIFLGKDSKLREELLRAAWPNP